MEIKKWRRKSQFRTSEIIHESARDCDLNEPTMGEKLASLDLLDDKRTRSTTKQGRYMNMRPPTADSMHLMLKQALQANDHALLLECLYTRDEEIIANSIFLLNPSDVLKLLKSFISMIDLRGAVLVSVLPWLKSLVIQHASILVSQDCSLLALNSLNQLIETRISTFGSTFQLCACLDYLTEGIPEDEAEDESTVLPAVFEDEDTDEESEDAMESEEGSETSSDFKRNVMILDFLHD